MADMTEQDGKLPLAVIQSILDGMVDCACLIDPETYRVLLSNGKTREVFGENAGKACYQWFHDADAPCETCPFHRLAPLGGGPAAPLVAEMYWKRAKTWYTVSYSFFIWLDGKSVCLVVLCPRADRSLRERELEALAYTDEKTGIANNHKYEQDGPELLERAEQQRRKVAVIALKVEGLHNINSVQGYAQGDAVLKNLAEAISRSLPEGTLFARQRGNDFSILYPMRARRDEPCSEELAALMARLERSVRLSCWASERFWCKLHLGVSLYPDHGCTFEGLNRKARQAVSICPAGMGIFSYTVYNGALMSDLRRREELKLDLALAVRKQQLRLLFQPQHEVRTARIVGAEALIRWEHPAYGRIGPNEFIPLAEETLLIPSIDEWVINEACRQWRYLYEEGWPVVPVSVNISPQKFYQPDLAGVLLEAMERYKLLPGMLEIELTERTALHDIDKAIEIMEKVRSKGIRIAMDDFGTGYSSLNYLRTLPFDVIKLDQSFISDSSDRAKSVLRTIVSLVKSYDAVVVFEGVETEDQYRFASQIGCDLVQGFYTGRPMGAVDMARLLAAAQGSPQH